MLAVMAVGGGVHIQSLLEKSWAQGHFETCLVKKLLSYQATQWTKSRSMENERRGTGQLIFLTLHLFVNISFCQYQLPLHHQKENIV